MECESFFPSPPEPHLLREAPPGLPICHNGNTIWEEKLSKLPSTFVLWEGGDREGGEERRVFSVGGKNRLRSLLGEEGEGGGARPSGLREGREMTE